MQQSARFALDTGLVLRYLRGDGRAAELLDYLESSGEICLSAITYMEILVGCRPNETDATRQFFRRVASVSVTPEVAEKAAFLVRTYPSAFGRNNPRQFPDALIAATAWELTVPLLTLNARHFSASPMAEFEVRVIDQNSRDWVTPLKG